MKAIDSSFPIIQINGISMYIYSMFISLSMTLPVYFYDTSKIACSSFPLSIFQEKVVIFHQTFDLST